MTTSEGSDKAGRASLSVDAGGVGSLATHKPDVVNPAYKGSAVIFRITSAPMAFWMGLLVCFEILVLRMLSVGKYLALSQTENAEVLLAVHTLSKGLVVVFLVTFVAAVLRGASGTPVFASERWRRVFIFVNLAAFSALLLLLATLPVGELLESVLSSSQYARYLSAIIAAVLMSLSGILLIFPKDVPKSQAAAVAVLLAVAALIYGGYLNVLFDFGRGLIEGTTLSLSLWFYALSGRSLPQLNFDGVDPLMVSAQFAIKIAPSCSGYQGMMSAFFLLGSYIAFERRTLRLKRAVLLSVIAIGATFVLNALRIALLFYIGEEVSTEVAVNGFHSQFGSLSLLVVSTCAIVAMETRFFRHSVADETSTRAERISPDSLGTIAVLMMPLAIYLLVGMVTGLFVGEFNWLYPIPVVVGSLVLWAFRQQLRSALTVSPSVVSILVGAAVFAIWIAMISPDPERADLLINSLSSSPVWMAVLWIAFRVFGSSVIVPIVEELAFRGGVLHLLEELVAPRIGLWAAPAFALIGSSVAFGLLHGDIIAGIVAGLIYGLLYLWRRALVDAIVAHAVTNFLICLYVLGFDAWSYW